MIFNRLNTFEIEKIDIYIDIMLYIIVFRINIYIYKFKNAELLQDFIYSLYQNIQKNNFKMSIEVISAIRESKHFINNLLHYFYNEFKPSSKSFNNITKDKLTFEDSKNRVYCKFYYEFGVLIEDKYTNEQKLKQDVNYN